LWKKEEPRDCGLKVQKERKGFGTGDAENTEKIEARKAQSKEKKSARRGAAGEASGGSVKRIVEEVDADAGHAIVTEGLDVGHAANEFAFEGWEGFNFLGNFQAKL
jgi:hypothetical protein